MKIRLVFSPVTWKKVSVIRTNNRAVLSAAILESHFRPKLLTKQHMRDILEELYEALIHV